MLRRLIVNKSNPPVRTDAAKSTAFVNETDYFGGALFHGKTFEIFPAGALGPFRIEHSGRMIRQIAAFDPIGENGAARRWQTAAVVQPAS